MAFKGADPYQIELLLKRRGDYRPHQDFGINLSIPWNAGGKEDPSFHVHSGSAYTTTQGLQDNTRAELGYTGGEDGYGGQLVRHVETQDLLEQFGEKAQVRGVGWGGVRGGAGWGNGQGKGKGQGQGQGNERERLATQVPHTQLPAPCFTPHPSIHTRALLTPHPSIHTRALLTPHPSIDTRALLTPHPSIHTRALLHTPPFRSHQRPAHTPTDYSHPRPAHTPPFYSHPHPVHTPPFYSHPRPAHTPPVYSHPRPAHTPPFYSHPHPASHPTLLFTPAPCFTPPAPLPVRLFTRACMPFYSHPCPPTPVRTCVGADRDARPWETVGGVGFGGGGSTVKSAYRKPGKRSDLTAASPEAKEVAEEFNDMA
eukprot:scaffold25069_cov87-Isochrysis_galbana.AAC.1